jgi:hypothetical protein
MTAVEKCNAALVAAEKADAAMMIFESLRPDNAMLAQVDCEAVRRHYRRHRVLLAPGSHGRDWHPSPEGSWVLKVEHAISTR